MCHDPSLPKKKQKEDPALCVLPIGESVRAFLARTCGKRLFVADGSALTALAGASRAADSALVVLEGEDALPLFSMPEEVRGVFAAGGGAVMRAARFFAQIRGVSCTLVPTSSALDGVFSLRGEVPLGDERMTFPLANGEVAVDPDLCRPSLAEGYARLCLARLAVFETRALSYLTGEAEPCEEMWRATVPCSEPSAEAVLQGNAAVRRAEAAGAYAGEGVALGRLIGGENGSIFAERALLALYAAFFRRGRPRYEQPSYPLGDAPTLGRYRRQRRAFELRRGDLLRELAPHLNAASRDRRIYVQFGGALGPNGLPAEHLKELPLREPRGLTACIRDFGLLEHL